MTQTIGARGFVSLATDGDVGVVTLERPDALNAISGAVADDLRDAFRAVGSRPDIRVMVLRGAGDKAFCVGADLKERSAFTLDDFHSNRRQMRGMFSALRDVPQPTIASVFGFALGGGFELALSCDVVVAAEGTQLGLPEARVGLLPAGGGTQLLPRKVGEARAKELVFTGRRFSAEEAHGMGLVARVVPRSELDAAAMELARDVCRSSPVAVREAKRAIEAALGSSIDDGLELENEAWARVVATEDRAEGIAAFNDKREPRWQNR
ncbi:MAG TPA: enoyl-CoA hydratase-related protein [Actinomycetota bacterium]|nr:enoyl-CoA hydratase-related protein [Actinomycetota bacterium]